MLLDFSDHLQAVWPAVITDQDRSLRFENATDLPKDVDHIIKTMQRTVGNHEIEVSALEPHVARIADLKDCPIVEFPGCRRFASAFHQRSRSIEPHGNEVLVLPDNLQRNQAGPSADVEHDSALDSKRE